MNAATRQEQTITRDQLVSVVRATNKDHKLSPHEKGRLTKWAKQATSFAVGTYEVRSVKCPVSSVFGSAACGHTRHNWALGFDRRLRRLHFKGNVLEVTDD